MNIPTDGKLNYINIFAHLAELEVQKYFFFLEISFPYWIHQTITNTFAVIN